MTGMKWRRKGRVGFRYPLSDEYNEKTRLLGYRYPTPRITNSYRDSSVESSFVILMNLSRPSITRLCENNDQVISSERGFKSIKIEEVLGQFGLSGWSELFYFTNYITAQK